MAFQGDSIYWVEVEKIVPNPFQPRREFDQHKLQELADSIRMYGVLQPLTVTRKEIQREDGTFYSEYELIAGERRLRASRLAGIAQVPVIIREGEQNEQEKLELAIIENLQREDLNAVDRAIAFKQLADMFGLSHAQVAQKMGRSREYVSNSIRLLALPEHMLDALKRADMMEGHARTLLMLSDRPEEQEVVFKEIVLKKLSVREVERIVRKIATDKIRKKVPGEFDANLIEFEKKFTETLGTRVQIQKTDFGGKLTIDYFSEDDLASILKRIKDDAQQTSTSDAVQKIADATPLTVEAVREDTDGSLRGFMTQQNPEPITHYAEPESWSESTEDNRQPEIHVDQVSKEVLDTPEPVVEIRQESPVNTYFAQAPSPVQPIVESHPQVFTPVEVPMVPEPEVSPMVIPPVPTPAQAPVVTPELKKEEDDGDLYSIRNFSV